MNPKMNQLLDGKPAFTAKQGQYLAFIHAYAQINGKAPAERDIQTYFKVTPPTAHAMILTLERQGLIARTPGRPRSIQILADPEFLPKLQTVKSSVQRY